MTCNLPEPLWWQDYLAGRLTTPQQIYNASLAEYSVRAGHNVMDRWLLNFDTSDNQWRAPEALKAPGHFKTAAWLKQIKRANYLYCDPRLMVWASTLVHMAMKRDIPLYVHTALRDADEQNKLKAQGNSKAVYPHSAHNIGEAVDIVHGTVHWNMTEQEWRMIGVLGNLALDRVNSNLSRDHKLKLEWGGKWTFYDPAHWEVSDYRSRTRILPKGEPVHLTPYQIQQKKRDLLSGYAAT